MYVLLCIHVEVNVIMYVNQDENRSEKKMQWMGENYLIHLFDYEMEHKKFLIWGLTAGILIRAASLVFQRPPAFMEQNPKFKLPRDSTV